MARKRSSSMGSTSELVINHFGAIRFRITGSASLQMTLFSLDDVENSILVPLTLQPITNIEPNRLSNFTQQRASLEIKTTEFDETFQISKIVIFVKPTAKSYPEI